MKFNFDLLKNITSSHSEKIFLIISSIIFAIAILLKIFGGLIFKNHQIKINLVNKIISWLTTISILGGMLLLFSWQKVYFFSLNFWWLMLGLIFLIWGVIILIYRLRFFPQEKSEFENIKRKEKYLPVQRGKYKK